MFNYSCTLCLHRDLYSSAVIDRSYPLIKLIDQNNVGDAVNLRYITASLNRAVA